MKRLPKYIAYILATLAIVFFFVNGVFKGLHDGGQFGMLAGLAVSQILLSPFMTSMKWWGKVLLAVVLVTLPISLAKVISEYLYAQESPGSIVRNIDTIAYCVYFASSILFIELVRNIKALNKDH